MISIIKIAGMSAIWNDSNSGLDKTLKVLLAFHSCFIFWAVHNESGKLQETSDPW